LKWIIDRVKGRASARETPIGMVPGYEDLNLDGLDFSRGKYNKLFAINKDEWTQELADIEEFFNKFGARVPQPIWKEYRALKGRL